MLCEKCKQREATTHVRNRVNSRYSEYMLCDECAREMGFSSFISDMHSDFTSFFDSLLSNALPERSGATRCRKCGASYTDILNDRRVGCEECYSTFKDELSKGIKRVHGSSSYVGKVPKAYEEQIRKENEIKKLKEELDECVKAQQYEKAAQIRDRIKEMEV